MRHDPFLVFRRLAHYRHPYRAVRFKAILIVDRCVQKGEHMNFTFINGQGGQLVITAVDAETPPQPAALPADFAAVSSDPSILTAAPAAGNAPGVTQLLSLKAGNVNVVATGTNAAGVVISTTFAFVVTAVVPQNPAAGFVATLINVS